MMINIIDNDYTIVIMVINNSDTTIVTIGIMVINNIIVDKGND